MRKIKAISLISQVQFLLLEMGTKNAKTKTHPKENVREAWNKLKQGYEPNTGTELLALHKKYMSLE